MDDQSTQVCEEDFYDVLCASEDDDDDSSFVTAVEDLIDSEEEREQIESDILQFIAEYVEENILRMSSPDFESGIVEATMDAFYVAFGDEHYDIVYAWFERLVKEYYSWGVFPARSRETVPPDNQTKKGLSNLLEHIDFLRKIPQPEQRTSAWFQFRHNVITASSVGKIFASEAQRNSLIYEKCKPLLTSPQQPFAAETTTNFDSPLHWGQKYEPLSVLIYEHMFETKVGAFGCLPHPTCTCLAASPDGINVDPTSTRFGRMLEIKNIVNREITGIPLEAYWIQMQIQMEVCDLDTCDFLETRFLEYPDADAFWYAVDADTNPEYLGIMLLFLDAKKCQQHRYEIMPIDVSLELDTVMAWIDGVQQQLRGQGWRLYETIYWYLEEYSCVLVDRNRLWFAEAKPKIEATWATIVCERIHGYEHRAPAKRASSSAEGAAVARSKAALAQLFATADEDRIVQAIQSDLSLNELIEAFA